MARCFTYELEAHIFELQAAYSASALLVVIRPFDRAIAVPFPAARFRRPHSSALIKLPKFPQILRIRAPFRNTDIHSPRMMKRSTEISQASRRRRGPTDTEPTEAGKQSNHQSVQPEILCEYPSFHKKKESNPARAWNVFDQSRGAVECCGEISIT